MIKRKYIFIPVVILIVFVLFKFQTGVHSQEVKKDKVEEKAAILNPDTDIEIENIILEYDSILSAGIKEAGTVGAAIVITYKNKIALLKCFGVQKKGEKESINKHTIFRLASVSKTITGTLASILANEGVIRFNEKVIRFLPELKLKNDTSTELLTVVNLLSHTSGLVPHAYDGMVEDGVPISKIINKLAEVDIAAIPGKLYGYQNVMFSLYDTIVAIKTLKPFGLVMKQKVFEPFRMTDASVCFIDFKNNKNKAIPHTGSNGQYRSRKLNNRYYNTAPAAGVNASISDMAHFLLTLLDKDSRVLNNHERKLLFTPQIKTPLRRAYFRQWDKVKSRQYAIGWRIVKYKGRTVAYHGGYVQGYRAEIAVCEEEQIGIAFLTNSPNGIESKTIPTFLNLFFKLKNSNKIKKTNA
jgi:beta-lactamase class C